MPVLMHRLVDKLKRIPAKVSKIDGESVAHQLLVWFVGPK